MNSKQDSKHSQASQNKGDSDFSFSTISMDFDSNLQEKKQNNSGKLQQFLENLGGNQLLNIEKELLKQCANPKVEEFIKNQKEMLKLEKEAKLAEYQSQINELSIDALVKEGKLLASVAFNESQRGVYENFKIIFTNFDRELNNEAVKQKFSNCKISGGDLVQVFRFNHQNLKLDPIFEDQVDQKRETSILISSKESKKLDTKEEYFVCLKPNLTNYDKYEKFLQAIDEKSAYNHYYQSIIARQPFEFSEFNFEEQQHKLYSLDKQLNEQQRLVIQKGVGEWPLLTIEGPPGTGKTKTICELIRQLIQKGNRILACSPTNVATDNIAEGFLKINYDFECTRLGRPSKVSQELKQISTEYLLTKQKDFQEAEKQASQAQKLIDLQTTQELKSKAQETYKKLQQKRNWIRSTKTKQIIARSKVVFATLMGTDNIFLSQAIEQTGKFDVVIIDEASCSLEVECWMAILKGKRFILAGDSNQLPPVILSDKAKAMDLGFTLLKRISKEYNQFSLMLRNQYRMHPKIMEWPNQVYYQNKLTADKSVQQNNHKYECKKSSSTKHVHPILFVNAEAREGSFGVSKFNTTQATVAVLLAQKLVTEYQFKKSQVGIISYYSAQASLINKGLKEVGLDEDIKCQTVDSFQGKEKDAVILSMVRSNEKKELGFLGEKERICVSMTRAKKCLAIICDPMMGNASEDMGKLMEYLKKESEIIELESFKGLEKLNEKLSQLMVENKSKSCEVIERLTQMSTKGDITKEELLSMIRGIRQDQNEK